jgi:hypothetical protein
MKEIEYDGPALKEPSAWEKRYAQNRALKAPLLRAPDVGGSVPQKSLPPRRSMYADMAQHEVSEQSRPAYEAHEEHEETHLGKIIFILLLVLAFGLGIGAYALIGTKMTILGGMDNEATTTPLVTSEDTDILLSDSPRVQILTDLAIVFGKTTLLEGGTRKVQFLVKGEGGVVRPATVKEFFQAINKFPGSDALVRSLDTPLLYEIGSDGTLVGKITLVSRSYANTFAEMLDWESALAQDLLPVLHPEFTQNKLKEIEGRVFRDERIGDIDARILRDALGNVLIVYGFVDHKTLVITGGKRMFAPVIPVSATE